MEEWYQMLRDLKSNKAPGISNISYTMLKQASEKAHKILVRLAEACIINGIVPIKWKLTQLYLIPKDTDWLYNLNNVRPIALIDSFRKCVTRILTKRLSKICIEKSLLEGLNFAGLKEDSTEIPIQIFNSLIKESKEEIKEIWLLLQDMKKAFDSVPLDGLVLALKRLKIPANIIIFIIELFNNRNIQIITAKELTESFCAEGGIEQGEVLSPLLWRIFYDPLLTKIQKNQELGYIMEMKIPTDICRNKNWYEHTRISAMAYADNTVWIASNKKQIEKIIKIANNFFRLNDIQIN